MFFGTVAILVVARICIFVYRLFLTAWTPQSMADLLAKAAAQDSRVVFRLIGSPRPVEGIVKSFDPLSGKFELIVENPEIGKPDFRQTSTFYFHWLRAIRPW